MFSMRYRKSGAFRSPESRGLTPGPLWLQVLPAILGVHLSAASVWAQTPGRPPEAGSGILPWCIAAGIVLVVCITAFINPKRSHLN